MNLSGLFPMLCYWPLLITFHVTKYGHQMSVGLYRKEFTRGRIEMTILDRKPVEGAIAAGR